MPSQHKEGYYREYYLSHKKEQYANVVKRRAVNKEYVDNCKTGKTCSRCPENHPAALVFHHTGDEKKDGTIANGARDWGLNHLKSEIEKCILLCSNCLAKLHWQERQIAIEKEKQLWLW